MTPLVVYFFYYALNAAGMSQPVYDPNGKGFASAAACEAARQANNKAVGSPCVPFDNWHLQADPRAP